MIGILINGKTIDLYPNAKIRLQFNHPAFSSELQTGSFSLPFNIPKSRLNQQIFAFPEQIQNRAYHYKPYACKVFLGGIYFFQGLLYLNSVSRDEYNVDISIDTGEFSNIIGKYQLNSDILNHGTYTLPRSVSGNPILSYNLLESDFLDSSEFKTEIAICKTIGTTITRNYGYEEVTGTPQEALYNYTRFFVYKAQVFDPYLAGSEGLTVAVYHQDFVTAITDQISLVMRRTNLTDNQVTFAYFVLQAKTVRRVETQLFYDDFAFPSYINQNFYPSESVPNFGQTPLSYYQVNAWRILAIQIENNIITNYYTLIPFMKLRYLIRKIAEFTNYEMIGDFLTQFQYSNIGVYNNYALDKPAEWSAGTNGFDENIVFQNHLPSIQINDFLIELAKLFGLYYSFDYKKNTCKFIFKKDLLKADVIDWTTKMTIDYVNSIEYPKKITVKYADNLELKNDEKNNLFKIGTIDPLTIGQFPDGENYELKIGTLYDNINLDATALYDIDTKQCTSTMFNIKNEMDLRLTNLKFIVSILGSGACLADNSMFKIAGEGGLYEAYHKDWINAIQNGKIYKREAVLNINDLVNLDLNKRYAIDFQLYLIKSIEIEISNSSNIIDSTAQIEILKLPYNFGNPFDYAGEDYHIDDYN